MPFALQGIGKGSHRCENAKYFLDMMSSIFTFWSDFHQNIQDFRIYMIKPTVMDIELISKYESKLLNTGFTSLINLLQRQR